jgi:mannose-1-phosphate guanylyltransferase
MPQRNIIVQPANRGTANGILLSLLHILGRDPDAKVVFLPSDHHVGDEMVLQGSLREAVKRLSDHADEVLLLGLQPDEVDPELGYIVLGEIDGVLHRVGRFVEKPPLELAARLTAAGALWNALIVVVRARALADIFDRLFPQVAAEMRAAVTSDAACTMEPTATKRLYERLRDADFSRNVLEIMPHRLRVLTVPACGWSDLGTPARVGRTLSRTPVRVVVNDAAVTAHLVNLAEQFMRGSELQSI